MIDYETTADYKQSYYNTGEDTEIEHEQRVIEQCQHFPQDIPIEFIQL